VHGCLTVAVYFHTEKLKNLLRRREMRKNRIAFGGALVAVLVVLSGCLMSPDDPSRSDTFDGPTLDAAWYVYDADCSGVVHDVSGADADSDVIEFVDGTLKINGNGRDFWGTRLDHVGIWRTDFTGDFDISVKVVEMAALDDTVSGNQWAKAGIVIAKGLAHFHTFGPVQESAQIGVVLDGDGDGSMDEHSFDPISEPPAERFPIWLRVKRTGDSFQAYYKFAEDAAWVSYEDPFTPPNVAADVQIGLFSVGRESATCWGTDDTCPTADCDNGFYTRFDDFVDLDPPEAEGI
jgi:hypothetical protein